MPIDTYQRFDTALSNGTIKPREPASSSTSFIRSTSHKFDKAIRGKLGPEFFIHDGLYFAWSLLWLAIFETRSFNEDMMRSTVVGLVKCQAVNNQMTLGVIDRHIEKEAGNSHRGFLSTAEAIGLDLDGMLADFTNQRIMLLDGVVQHCVASKDSRNTPLYYPLIFGMVGRKAGDPPRDSTPIDDHALTQLLTPQFEKYYPIARRIIDQQVRDKAYRAFETLFDGTHDGPFKVSAQSCGTFLASRVAAACNSEAARSVARQIGYKDTPFFGAKKRQTRLMAEYLIVHVALAIHAANVAFSVDHSRAVIDTMIDALGGRVFGRFEEFYGGFKTEYSVRMREYVAVFEHNAPLDTIAPVFTGGLGIDSLSNAAAVFAAMEPITRFFDDTVNGLRRITLADPIV